MEEDNLPSTSLIVAAPKGKRTSKKWPCITILLYLIIMVPSFAQLLQLSMVQKKFQGSCPFYGHPYVTEAKNKTFSFETDEENGYEWGSDVYCTFSFFTAALSSAVAFIWCWFFFYSQCDHVLGEGNFGKNNEQRCLLLPAIIFAIFMVLLCLVQSSIISDGIGQLCDYLTDTVVKSCQNADIVEWQYFPKNGFYVNFQILMAESWCATIFWILLLILFSVQCITGQENLKSEYQYKSDIKE